MSNSKINQKVLVSGADYFRVEELNPYSHKEIQPDQNLAGSEHALIVECLKSAGIDVIKVSPPKDCQDGIYTANWALCWKNKAVMSSLPNMRQAEEPYALQTIRNFGYEIITPPFRFSGQGDALVCGDMLFVGSVYRSDPRMADFLAEVYDCKVIPLQTIPELDQNGNPAVNRVTGWPDSYFYDLDIALSILTPDLIAWCPEAFNPESQSIIRSLKLNKIEVPLNEAKNSFACNLVSTGEIVIMSDQAPILKKQILAAGLKVVTPRIVELGKGGGSIRCCSLTLA